MNWQEGVAVMVIRVPHGDPPNFDENAKDDWPLFLLPVLFPMDDECVIRL